MTTTFAQLGLPESLVRSLVHGFRPQVLTADATKAPGIVIFDSEFNVTWVHRGEMLGDYPPVDDLIERINSPTP